MQSKVDSQIYNVFENIAEKYDLANDIFTFGQHRIWKRKVLKYSNLTNDSNYLDVATGTGDLPVYLYDKMGINCSVYATDINEKMLDVFKRRAQELNFNFDISTQDARNLKYKNDFFDAITISYGIRNIPNPEKAISEFHRVLTNNGIFVVLETGVPNGHLKLPYSFYVKNIVPFLGKIITKKKWAYEYLNKTANNFPYSHSFVDLVKSTSNFELIKLEKKLFGASYIYVFKAIK